MRRSHRRPRGRGFDTALFGDRRIPFILFRFGVAGSGSPRGLYTVPAGTGNPAPAAGDFIVRGWEQANVRSDGMIRAAEDIGEIVLPALALTLFVLPALAFGVRKPVTSAGFCFCMGMEGPDDDEDRQVILWTTI